MQQKLQRLWTKYKKQILIAIAISVMVLLIGVTWAVTRPIAQANQTNNQQSSSNSITSSSSSNSSSSSAGSSASMAQTDTYRKIVMSKQVGISVYSDYPAVVTYETEIRTDADARIDESGLLTVSGNNYEFHAFAWVDGVGAFPVKPSDLVEMINMDSKATVYRIAKSFDEDNDSYFYSTLLTRQDCSVSATDPKEACLASVVELGAHDMYISCITKNTSMLPICDHSMKTLKVTIRKL